MFRIRRPALPASALAGLLLLAPRAAEAVNWRPFTSPTNNFSVATAGTGYFLAPSVCSDGRGGFWVAYVDSPSTGDTDIRLERLSGDGTGDHFVIVTNDAANQHQPRVLASDSGGVYVAWRDTRNAATTSDDIYVQYVGPEGLVRWAANGVQCTNAAGSQHTPFLGEGSSGVLVAWMDERNGIGNTDVYYARVTHSGVLGTAAGGSIVSDDASDAQELSGARADDGILLVWRGGAGSDIHGQHLSSFGFENWGFLGELVICSAAGIQANPSVVADGENGAYVAWQDFRSGVNDIYVQRVSEDGVLDFTANGTHLCNAANDQTFPRTTPDGAGGVMVAWIDARVSPASIFAQRVSPNGAPLWTANGVDVASGIDNTPYDHALVADGLGGAFVAWSEARVNGVDLYGQRLSSTGAVQWSSAGALLSAAPQTQDRVAIAAGAENSLLAVWEDFRDALDINLYAQRIDRFGFLGEPAPNLVDVSDVLGDQGGQVRLDWEASYVEFDPHLQVTTYFVLREVPAALAMRMQRGGTARFVSEPVGPAGGERVVLIEEQNAVTTFWEYVGQMPAFQSDTYSYVAPTTSDSVPGVPASTRFRVQARNASGSRFWFSNERVGHSIDNLAPLTPAPFAGTYSGGSTRLTWNPNHEVDLAGYRLYRGTTPGFVPGPGNQIAALTDTGHVDAGGAPFVYKLTAIDVHLNESAPATLLPSGTVDVSEPRFELAFAAPTPNPAAGPATLRLTLSREGPTGLAIYDAQGREVRALVDGARPAGHQAVTWDLRDAAGNAVAPGLYFARLQAEGRTLTRRLAVVR